MGDLVAVSAFISFLVSIAVSLGYSLIKAEK